VSDHVATTQQWVQAARPRTLPAAVAPVLVGTGAGIDLGGFSWLRGGLALIVSLALQVGVNYANDYSDGVRGTDTVRVGPTRLVGAGLAAPKTVKTAAFACFGVAGLAGLALAAMTSWWLVPVGLASVAAAWFYTGGPKPYGYAGLGELFVFVFFGLVAVLGTTYVQAGTVTLWAVIAAIGIGLLACALLMANNLRDVHTDVDAGKRTLAVLLGEQLSRKVFALMIVGAFLAVLALAPSHPWCLLGLLAVPLAVPPTRAVLRGARGRDLITVLGQTGRLEFVYSVLVGAGLALEAWT
jgi:1,4-dihydroxy-2-naphthoate octaprenyltransferase